MIDAGKKQPLYIKATILLVGMIALVLILYIAQDIIVPIVFSLVLAVLLHPVVNFLVRKKINRVVAICISLLITIIVIISSCALLLSQASSFSDSWPVLVDKCSSIIDKTVIWAAGYLDINPQRINEWITQVKGELINTSSAAVGQTLMTLGNWVMVLCLVPVYIFIILYYEPLLLEFIRRLFAKSNLIEVNEIITQIKTVIQRYLVGLLIEFVIVAVLNSVCLLILGIDYAILLGVIGALLNLVPYIGGLVAVALPMMVALATKSTAWYSAYVLIGYYLIQLIDNNFIVPKIVASKVKINALFSIIVVLAGYALWGISGMFLSIPLLAIVKLICDHIEPLKPWGFLLGNTMPSLLKLKPIVLKRKKR